MEEKDEMMTVNENAAEQKTKKAKKEKKEKKPVDKAKKKKIRRVVLAVVAVVLIASFSVSRMAAANAPVMVPTTPALTGEVEQTVNTSGTVVANTSKSYFSEVKAGDVLIEYDADELAKEKQLAELSLKTGEGNYKNSIQNNNQMLGDLNEANVNLAVLDQQIADTEAYIKGLEEKIEQKKSDLAHFGALLQISILDWQDQPDSDEYMNLQKMVQLNSWEQNNNEEIRGWQDELDVYNKMLSDYKEYRSEMKSQKSSAEAGKLTSGAKEEIEATNQTKEIQAQDTIDSLANVENGIKADFDGVVTDVKAVEGASVADSSELLKLESTQDVSVKVYVTKYDLEKISQGQDAVVTVAGKEYKGKVGKINKMAEKNNSGAAVVGTEVEILNPDSDIVLGVEAKIAISTARVTDCVMVPVSVVNVDMDGEFVYVVENGVLAKRRVVTGISSDTMVQISEGLAEGEGVVTSVSAGMTEGMAVMAMQ